MISPSGPPERHEDPGWRRRGPCPGSARTLARFMLGLSSFLLASCAAALLVEVGLRVSLDLPPGFRAAGTSELHRLLPGDEREYGNLPRGGADPVCVHGHRGPCVPEGRTPGVPRLAVVGDSVTFGHGVSPGDAWPAVLERGLEAARGADVEVLNAAVPGYDLPRAVATWRQSLRAFHPDVVLYGFFVNDLEGQRVVPAPGRPGAVLMVVPESVSLPGERWLPRGLHRWAADQSWLYGYVNVHLAGSWGPAIPARTLAERARPELARFQGEVAGDGARAAVVLVPPAALHGAGGRSCGDAGLAEGRVSVEDCAGWNDLLDAFGGVAEQAGLPVLDGRRAWRTVPNELGVALTPDDAGHTGPAGHRALGEWVAAALAEAWPELLLRPPAPRGVGSSPEQERGGSAPTGSGAGPP